MMMKKLAVCSRLTSSSKRKEYNAKRTGKWLKWFYVKVIWYALVSNLHDNVDNQENCS